MMNHSDTLFQRKIIFKSNEDTLTELKKSSSKEPLDQFQLKIESKNFCMKGNQVCSNEGPCLFTKEDNYNIAKIH